MMRWTLFFLMLAVVATILGFSGLASAAAGLFVAFLLGYLAPGALFGQTHGPRPRTQGSDS